jgi:hypothetical protein
MLLDCLELDIYLYYTIYLHLYKLWMLLLYSRNVLVILLLVTIQGACWHYHFNNTLCYTSGSNRTCKQATEVDEKHLCWMFDPCC